MTDARFRSAFPRVSIIREATGRVADTEPPASSESGRMLYAEQIDLGGVSARAVRLIPIDRIIGRQRRIDADPERLAHQIRQLSRPTGKIAPLKVADLGRGLHRRWLVLDGHHRYWAAQELLYDRLPVLPMTPWNSRGRKPGVAVQTETHESVRPDQVTDETSVIPVMEGHWVREEESE